MEFTKFSLCRDYLGFGIVLLLVGAGFMLLTALTEASTVKIAVSSFFIVLGTIDLTLYYIFRDRNS